MPSISEFTGYKKTYVEIGAADFDTLLPLSRRGWRGVIVEPVPRFAEALRKIVDSEGLDVQIIEAAITTHSGTTKFLESLEQNVVWQKGISHLKNQDGTRLLELHANKHIPRREIMVNCLRLDNLLWDICRLQHVGIDFLKMDIEGHELDVLNDYSWNIKPTMIKIEHKHCSDFSMRTILEKNGYTVWVENDDMYGIR